MSRFRIEILLFPSFDICKERPIQPDFLRCHKDCLRIISMSEDDSYLVKKRDLAEIIHSKDSAALSEFLKDPRSVIAGVLIEGFSHGPSAFTQPLIRVGVAALTGRALEQFAKEIRDFREKGRIPDDWAEKPKGYQTWVELLRVIDEENPDEERLNALKAMFFAVNRMNTADAERIVAYQLFQIAKKLTSGELLLLKAVNGIKDDPAWHQGGTRKDFKDWANAVGVKLGHSMVALIEHHETALIENNLLAPRVSEIRTAVATGNGRLTDLGIKFCENIECYQIDKPN